MTNISNKENQEEVSKAYVELNLGGWRSLEQADSILFTGFVQKQREDLLTNGVSTDKADYGLTQEEIIVDGQTVGHVMVVQAKPKSNSPDIPRAIVMQQPYSPRHGFVQSVSVITTNGEQKSVTRDNRRKKPTDADTIRFVNANLKDFANGLKSFLEKD